MTALIAVDWGTSNRAYRVDAAGAILIAGRRVSWVSAVPSPRPSLHWSATGSTPTTRRS